MIHNFSASYAGHLVDENIGLQGTPANDRWYTHDHLREGRVVRYSRRQGGPRRKPKNFE